MAIDSANNQIYISRHNISPDRVLFAYRDGDAESLEIAEYYASKRQLGNQQLCALPVANADEVNYDDYIVQIEDPILTCMRENFPSGSDGRFVLAIIIGFNVPYRLNYFGEIIAVASRLHRIGHAVELKRPNHTFNRKSSQWKYFDDLDNTELMVTAVINGPTKENTKALIDRSILVDNYPFASGKIVLDPFGKKDTGDQLEYQQEILDFIDLDIPYLGSTYSTTTDDPYKDPIISELLEDSFHWGWFTDIASPQMFKDSRTARVFSYNADDNGASNIRETTLEGGKWLNVALQVSNPGYASSAGAVAKPGDDAFVFPRPFFDTLHREAGIGEAFLYANKFVDWKMMLVGDPLMVTGFPLTFLETNLKANDDVLRASIRTIENMIKKMNRFDRLMNDIMQIFLDSPSFDKQFVFAESANWRDILGNKESLYNYLSKLFVIFSLYQKNSTDMTLSQWLDVMGDKVSNDFRTVLSSNVPQTIRDDQIYNDGYWEFEFTYLHSRLTLEDVHFIIQVSRNIDFIDAELQVHSIDSVRSWFYEKEEFKFYGLPSSGLPSNYSGRRVRFISPEEFYLRPTELYYVKTIMEDPSLTFVSEAQELIV